MPDLADPVEHYVTPDWVVRALLNVENMGESIWEPCCGTGEMASAIKQYYPVDVFGSTIEDLSKEQIASCSANIVGGVNLFSVDSALAPSVVTNPPFKRGGWTKIVEHLSLIGVQKIALLLPANYYSGRSRDAFFDKFTPTKIYTLKDRVTMYPADWPEDKKKNTSPVIYAWFVWDLSKPNNVTIAQRIPDKKLY